MPDGIPGLRHVPQYSVIAILAMGLGAAGYCSPFLDGRRDVTRQIDFDRTLVRFVTYHRAEFAMDASGQIATDASGNRIVIYDTREGGVSILPQSKCPESLQKAVDVAQDWRSKSGSASARFILPAKTPLVLVGRLPGTGTGRNRCYSTQLDGIKEFFLDQDNVFLLLTCSFRGPYIDGVPKTVGHYFAADLPPLAPGNYSVTVRILPVGQVYREYRFNKWKSMPLPEFGSLICNFTVSEVK
ncbi:MAG: hypothetical protein JWN70_2552 [Planctomycetaceae bacterium]|nr:hypothetical protein [Planctomycetaceae bacterium]